MDHIGIQDIEFYLPEGTIDASELGQKFDLEDDFLTRKIGITKLFMAGPKETTSDLASTALKRLLDKHPGIRERIGALVVCTQTPDFGLPHTAALVQHKCGLSNKVAAWDISLGCSGFVHSLAILEAFMRSQGLEYGVLVTSETYSKIIDETDRDTKCLFSDAAAAILVSRSPWLVAGKYVFATHGEKSESLILGYKEGGDFRGSRSPLYMNGRGIFQFVTQIVPRQLEECLSVNGKSLGDISHVLLHQASRFVLDKLAENLGLQGQEKFVILTQKYGNTVSSSIPIALKHIQERVLPGQSILTSGFGVGLASATTVLTRSKV